MENQYRTCSSCGGPRDRRALLCRACRDAEPLSKVCRGCNTEFPIETFGVRPNGRGGHKRRSRCRTCEAKEGRDHRGRTPAQQEARRIWKRENYQKDPDIGFKQGMLKAFTAANLTFEEGLRLYNAHSKRCDICDELCKTERRLAVDHDHITGKFRGFLCKNCNNAIGMFKDSPELLQKAIAYLGITV